MNGGVLKRRRGLDCGRYGGSRNRTLPARIVAVAGRELVFGAHPRPPVRTGRHGTDQDRAAGFVVLVAFNAGLERPSCRGHVITGNQVQALAVGRGRRLEHLAGDRAGLRGTFVNHAGHSRPLRHPLPATEPSSGRREGINVQRTAVAVLPRRSAVHGLEPDRNLCPGQPAFEDLSGEGGHRAFLHAVKFRDQQRGGAGIRRAVHHIARLELDPLRLDLDPFEHAGHQSALDIASHEPLEGGDVGRRPRCGQPLLEGESDGGWTGLGQRRLDEQRRRGEDKDAHNAGARGLHGHPGLKVAERMWSLAGRQAAVCHRERRPAGGGLTLSVSA